MIKRLFPSMLILCILTPIGYFTYKYYMNTPPLQDSLTKGKGGVCELSDSDYKDGFKRFADVKRRMEPLLEVALAEKGLKLGEPVFLRSFKEERELELWMLASGSNTYKHVHTWKIKGLSGKLGPKFAEGDKQSPEGFYRVTLPQFLHKSSNHLAFNIGYPNAYDRAHQRTGSFIMVHGHTGSIGCLAMTDPYIEEIYPICHAALKKGSQSAFQIHLFPYRMTAKKMQEHEQHQHYDFWLNLKEGYDFFTQNRFPPVVKVANKTYVFE